MEYKERGQALLIVVLVMVVSLTVGLSVVSRSITNLRTTNEEEQSQRAFSAAEAGIEQALKTGAGIASSTQLGNASIKEVTVTQIGGTNQFLLNGGNAVPKDSGADIWLSDNPTFANPKSPTFFSIYWGTPTDGDCTTAAAIEVIVVSGATINSSSSTRYAFDPCSSRGNNFSTPDTGGTYTISGKTFKYRTPVSNASSAITLNSGLIVRAIPLYANTIMGVWACNSGGNNCTILPVQAKKLESTGASGTTTRKITVFQGFPQLPAEFFQYVLFCAKNALENACN